MAKILVIDRNEAFATMLKEMLEMSGAHQVQVASRGREGLGLLRHERCDLTMVDMDQERDDVDYAALVQEIRRVHPHMRIVLIPLMGQDVPPEALQLNIQGVLSKPFFVDDLLPSITDALSRSVAPPPRVEPASPTASAPPPAAAPVPAPAGAANLLSQLARETQADVVLLASVADDRPRVLGHVSAFDDTRIQQLADVVVSAARAGNAAAAFLGRPGEAYTHHMFENEHSRLYLMALPHQLLVAVVTSIQTPLGTIRHNLRRASRDLAGVE